MISLTHGSDQGIFISPKRDFNLSFKLYKVTISLEMSEPSIAYTVSLNLKNKRFSAICTDSGESQVISELTTLLAYGEYEESDVSSSPLPETTAMFPPTSLL